MATRKLIAVAIAAAFSIPASASVVVIGNSLARQCFESADSPLQPANVHVRECDMALQEALSHHDLVATHVNRGILRLRRGQLDPAIADFDEAIALDPRQPESYLNKGAAMIRRDNPTEALQLFTMALERNTRRPEIAHFGRAIANETLGNLPQAYADYRRASELKPEWDEPRTELARFRVINR